MTARRTRLLCHHCFGPITADERHHYVYECHACVVREHELVLLLAREPDHPDVAWLEAIPVEIGLPPRPAAS